MCMKISFFICLSVCIIGSIFCDDLTVFNPARYVTRKQYYLSDPIDKVDLVYATAKCLALELTLASIDDIQDQQILLSQLTKDSARYSNSGPSEFWLLGPNGLNELKPVSRSLIPHPNGYNLLALPYGRSGKCVKLVFTPFNARWEYDNCQGKYRFICTENMYSPRSLLKRLKNKIKSAFSRAGHILKWIKSKLLKTTAYSVAEINTLLEIIREYLGSPDDYVESLCPEISEYDAISVLEDCTKAVATNLRALARTAADSVKRSVKSVISKIRKGLHWSKEKAREAVGKVLAALHDQDEDDSDLYSEGFW